MSASSRQTHPAFCWDVLRNCRLILRFASVNSFLENDEPLPSQGKPRFGCVFFGLSVPPLPSIRTCDRVVAVPLGSGPV